MTIPFLAIESIIGVFLISSTVWLWRNNVTHSISCSTERKTEILHQDFQNFNSGSDWSKGNMAYAIEDSLSCISPGNIAVTNSELAISINRSPSICSNQKMSYTGGSLKSQMLFSPPFKLTCRLKAAKGSGLVTGCYTYTGPPKTEHNEIDIEILGNKTEEVQFNLYRYKGDKGNEFTYQLPFDAAEEFHNYTLEVNTKTLRWYIDGLLIHTLRLNRESEYTLPQRAIVSAWVSDSAIWAGPVAKDFLTTSAKFKSITVEHSGCTESLG